MKIFKFSKQGEAFVGGTLFCAVGAADERRRVLSKPLGWTGGPGMSGLWTSQPLAERGFLEATR